MLRFHWEVPCINSYVAPRPEVPNIANSLWAYAKHVRDQFAFPLQWIWMALTKKQGFEVKYFTNKARAQDGTLGVVRVACIHFHRQGEDSHAEIQYR